MDELLGRPKGGSRQVVRGINRVGAKYIVIGA